MSVTDNLCLSLKICVCHRHIVSATDNFHMNYVTVTNNCFCHKTPLQAISVKIYVISDPNCPSNRSLSIINGAHGAQFVEPWGLPRRRGAWEKWEWNASSASGHWRLGKPDRKGVLGGVPNCWLVVVRCKFMWYAVTRWNVVCLALTIEWKKS